METESHCSNGGSVNGGEVEEAEPTQEWTKVTGGQECESEEEESGGGVIVRNRKII